MDEEEEENEEVKEEEQEKNVWYVREISGRNRVGREK